MKQPTMEPDAAKARRPYKPNRRYMDEFDTTIPYGNYLGWFVEIRAIMWCYKRKINDFEIGLWASRPGERFEVASIDACDSEIHVHRLRRSNPFARNEDRRTVVELSHGDWDTVDLEYQVQLDWMDQQWPALMRSWDEH